MRKRPAARRSSTGSAEPDETLHDGGRTEPHDREAHHGHRTNRRVQHAAEHGGNERARLVHYVHHGHRATHHILAMGAEHLRQRRLHRRRLHRVKHGEHHLHHGYRRQIETGGRKDRHADEHRHGGRGSAAWLLCGWVVHSYAFVIVDSLLVIGHGHLYKPTVGLLW